MLRKAFILRGESFVTQNIEDFCTSNRIVEGKYHASSVSDVSSASLTSSWERTWTKHGVNLPRSFQHSSWFWSRTRSLSCHATHERFIFFQREDVTWCFLQISCRYRLKNAKKGYLVDFWRYGLPQARHYWSFGPCFVSFLNWNLITYTKLFLPYYLALNIT